MSSSAASRVRRPRAFWACLLLLAGLFITQGIWLAQRMVTWTDESAYVHFGYLVASGQISLFQDELTGSRVPLPFWIVGLSQVLWGRSLLAARLMSLGLGVIAMILTALLARRLSGDLAGVLAAAFLATQGVLVGYFATATYHGLAATLLLGGITLVLAERQPSGRLLGMAVISLLFLVRTNLWPIVPAVLGLVAIQGRTRRERFFALVAAIAVPIVFFLSDARHLKLLLYVPVVNRLTGWLGHANPWVLIEMPSATWSDWLWAAMRFGRMYEFWMLALLLLAIVILTRWMRGLPIRAFFSDRRVNLLAALVAYIGIWQVLILWSFLKSFVAWFPSWSPLVAILLGVGFSTAFTAGGWTMRARGVVVVMLAAIFVAPSLIVRHPLLPSGPQADSVPLRDLSAAAAHLGRLIPPGSNVFLWGDSLPLYMAGITPYLRQIHSPFTLAVVDDRAAIEKNGLWGRQEMQTWLRREATHAVLEQRITDHYQHRAPARLAEIRELLDEHFVWLDRVEDYPWFLYDVYGRRPPTDRRGVSEGGTR